MAGVEQQKRSNNEMDDISIPAQVQQPHAKALAQHADSIRRLHRQTLGNLVEIGRLLITCKNLVGHGNWLPWLRREFARSERTARNYIAVHEYFGTKSANIADLSIDLTSLYLIIAPSIPGGP
jgi:hypothetical protein